MSGWPAYVGLLLLGGALLYLGAEWLVGGSARLAQRLKVSPLVVGLTVVAYGTSAPEVVVSLQAGFSGHGELALGNILGSNIANLGLILGFTAMIRPARVARGLATGAVPALFLSTLLLTLFLVDGVLDRWEAALLLLLSCLYTLWVVRRARAEGGTWTVDTPPAGGPLPLGLLVVVGLFLLVLGGHLLVLGASRLAMVLGMSERLIGLTIVAVGTSVPELATSVVAALRGHGDLAVGNVVGSNIFNSLLCLGAGGLAGGIRTAPLLTTPDFPALFLITGLALFLLRRERTLLRAEGALLLACYLGYLVWLGAA